MSLSELVFITLTLGALRVFTEQTVAVTTVEAIAALLERTSPRVRITYAAAIFDTHESGCFAGLMAALAPGAGSPAAHTYPPSISPTTIWLRTSENDTVSSYGLVAGATRLLRLRPESVPRVLLLSGGNLKKNGCTNPRHAKAKLGAVVLEDGLDAGLHKVMGLAAPSGEIHRWSDFAVALVRADSGGVWGPRQDIASLQMLRSLEEVLGYRFRDISLLDHALTLETFHVRRLWNG
ncbi:hypothetical protein BGZ65_006634 [Modicella reniformis]|uniref:Uncharacterized protein n=1 Tax=Modicella reniformis TaxID=1440133 RepID=A0A9P6IJA6_9FUNG|nr:hypothetical protein BGZ65_006634 [Modicella reniformis]